MATTPRTATLGVPRRAARMVFRALPTAIACALCSAIAAWAAVDGASLVDGSVTGRKIRDSTITSFDLAPGSVGSADVRDASLRGIDVAPRSIPPGDLTPAARSSAIETIVPDQVPVSFDETPLVSVLLPAGTWHVMGAVEVANYATGDNALVICTLSTGGVQRARRLHSLDTLSSFDHAATIDVTTTMTFGVETTVTLGCVRSGPSTSVGASNRQLLATRLTSAQRTGSFS